jgi:hypothetical protein
MTFRAGVPIAVVATLAVAVLANAATRPERLPTAKPGPILPSAAGVVLGTTTKPQLLRRWGPASECRSIPVPTCGWYGAMNKNFELADSVSAAMIPRANVVDNVDFYSASWRNSRLRGWSLPGNIRIGSTFAALKRAYPKVRWVRSSGRGSTWIVPRYDLGGQMYQLTFFLDQGAVERTSGHVLQLSALWFGTPLTCKLDSTPARGPEGEVDGRRIRGSCSGATRARLDEEAQPGGIRPLRLKFEPRGAAQITSVKASRCTGGPSTTGGYADCLADANGWPVDVTLGFDSDLSFLEMTVQQPAGIPPEVAKELRFRLP